MVAEGVVSSSFSRPPLPSSSVARNPSSMHYYPLPDLAYAEREALRTSVGGCFHCRLTPASFTWKNHNSRSCPGDKSCGLPPRAAPSTHTIATITPESPHSGDAPDSNLVAATAASFPSSYVLLGDNQFRQRRGLLIYLFETYVRIFVAADIHFLFVHECTLNRPSTLPKNFYVTTLGANRRPK